MSENRVWPRPVFVCEPGREDGGQSISLVGDGWRFSPEAIDGFSRADFDISGWREIPVPMSLSILGIRIPSGVEYAYARDFVVPADYEGRRVILRFDSVNCEARLFVNGQYIRSHFGGFNAWDADVTEFVKIGQENRLTLGVTNRTGLMSQFHAGGIQRDIRLFSLPQCHLVRLHAETALDGQYRDGTLRVAFRLSRADASVIRLTLENPAGVKTVLDEFDIASCDDESREYPVPAPAKWDSEHPNLYRLTCTLSTGKQTEVFSRKIGFRVIERRENQVFVNGDEVKLRGVDREEVHALKGRAISEDDILQDVLLLKDANCNFVRTSHYNPSRRFLELCDEYGIYVEEETSVSFIGQGQDYSNDDPQFTACFMDQFAEMIESDRSHPCVIMWSLANESVWGGNFAKELRYARAEDPTRLTIFSYPITMLEDDEMVDVWSAHYNHWDQDPAAMTANGNEGGSVGSHKYPVLHDEYIHVPCYNKVELGADPGIREAWGESIKRFWDSIFDTTGALGGAIWCFSDEVWLCEDRPESVFEWGIVDAYHRKKPEHWLTKKGYSPIRIETEETGNPGHAPLHIPVYNRYNHTNLREIRIRWSAGGESGECAGPCVAPRARGEIELPARNWQDGDVVTLLFVETSGLVCDEFDLPVKKTPHVEPVLSDRQTDVSETQTEVCIAGDGFRYVFDKETGLFSLYSGDREIASGPHLHLKELPLAQWELEQFSWEKRGAGARVTETGRHGRIHISYQMDVDGDGLMRIGYTYLDMPYAPHAMTRKNYGGGMTTHCGGYAEVGLSFRLPGCTDRLEWEREGLWSRYPDDHIARLRGTAEKLRGDGQEEAYRVTPAWDWKDDMRNYKLFGLYDRGGRGTQDFTSAKPGVTRAKAYCKTTGAGLEILSDGSDAVRCAIALNPACTANDDDPRIRYIGNWKRQQDKFGCLGHTEMVSDQVGDACEFTFTGTGVSWIPKRNACYGTARVLVDGCVRLPRVSLSTVGTPLRGYERVYDQVAYTVEGLPQGEHVIRIEVTGEPVPAGKKYNSTTGNYVSVDYFVVQGEHLCGDVELFVDNELNYPGLGWGNYMKPMIRVDTGYTNRVFIKPGI